MLPDVEEAALRSVGAGYAVKYGIDAWKKRGQRAWMCDDNAETRVPVKYAVEVQAQDGHWRSGMCGVQVRDKRSDDGRRQVLCVLCDLGLSTSRFFSVTNIPL